MHNEQNSSLVVENKEKTTENIDNTTWEEVIPLGNSSTLPTLDAEILPPILKNFCIACSESIEVPLESVLCASLACISIAIQKKFYVEIKEGYREPTNTYWLLALPPSERKSAVIALCRKPLEEWEKKKQKEYNKKIESEHKTLQKAIDYKRTQTSKAKKIEYQERMREIIDLENTLPDEDENKAGINACKEWYTLFPTARILPILNAKDIAEMQAVSVKGKAPTVQEWLRIWLRR